MPVSLKCCDCRWSCHRGDPSGELARAKEQARNSNAAALKAVEELRAEQAAHCQRKERMAKMAIELKDAADRYQLLEK